MAGQTVSSVLAALVVVCAAAAFAAAAAQLPRDQPGTVRQTGRAALLRRLQRQEEGLRRQVRQALPQPVHRPLPKLQDILQ